MAVNYTVVILKVVTLLCMWAEWVETGTQYFTEAQL
jgi:hypothetical protein